MSFKKRYPDFAVIEEQIHRARAERSVYIATQLSEAIIAIVNGVKRVMSGAPAAKPARDLARPLARN